MQNERGSDGPLEEVADDGQVQENPHSRHQVGFLTMLIAMIGEVVLFNG